MKAIYASTDVQLDVDGGKTKFREKTFKQLPLGVANLDTEEENSSRLFCKLPALSSPVTNHWGKETRSSPSSWPFGMSGSERRGGGCFECAESKTRQRRRKLSSSTTR